MPYTNSERSPSFSSNYSPESDASVTTPDLYFETPDTPPSNNHYNTNLLVQDLASPLEEANERRRKALAARHGAKDKARKDEYEKEIHNYYTEQYEGQITRYCTEIRKLESQVEKLKQAPGHDYLIILEEEILVLRNANEQFSDRNEELRSSEQRYRVQFEKLAIDADKLQQELANSNATINMQASQHQDAQTRELLEDLKFSREENGRLYEQCMLLQQENDEFNSSEENDNNVSHRLKLLKVCKYAMLSESDRISIKTELLRLSDQLDERIESRMSKEGGLFDHTDLASDSDVLLTELKITIKRQQDEIEELRNRENQQDNLQARLDLDDTLPSPTLSLSEELEDRFGVLTRELEQTRDELARQKSHCDALETFKEQTEQNSSGSKHRSLQEQTRQQGDFANEFNDKIRKLHGQLEELKARLHEDGIDKESLDASDILENVHDLLEDCGKMIILSNNIQDMDHLATPGTASSMEFVTKIESQIELSRAGDDRFDGEDSLPADNTKRELEDLVLDKQTTVEPGWPWNYVSPMLDKVFVNLFEGVTDDEENDDLVWPSTPVTKHIANREDKNVPRIIEMSPTAPPVGPRLWTEMICAGNTYWTEIALKDRIVWIKISGPFWWSWIIQLLTWFLIPSLTYAWWCIMIASAERQLWLDANEITFRKYWDTSVWGAERGFMWRVFYGLGYI